LTAESDSVAFDVTPMNTPKLLSITAILALALTGANSTSHAATKGPVTDAIKVTAPKATYVAGGTGTIDLTKVFASTSKAAGSAYTFTTTTPNIVTISGSTATIKSAGSATINAALTTEPAGYIGNPTASSTFVIAQAKAPAFTVTANNAKPNYAPGATVTLTPSALPSDFSSSSLTYSVSGPATVSGNIVTLTGAGKVTVTVTPPVSVNYAAPKAVAVALTVGLGTPNLSVSVPSQIPAGTLDLSQYVTRTPSDSLNIGAITYTTKTKGVTISGNSATLATNAGAVTITAAQAATANYAAIKAVTISFTVVAGKVNDTINPVTLVTQTAPGASYSLPTATAVSGLPVTATASGAGSVAGGKVTPSGEGTITITFSTAGDAGHNAATLVKTIVAHKVGNLYTFSAQ
jgi:hypothetical protein